MESVQVKSQPKITGFQERVVDGKGGDEHWPTTANSVEINNSEQEKDAEEDEKEEKEKKEERQIDTYT